jgi:subtilisin family serine protease
MAVSAAYQAGILLVASAGNRWTNGVLAQYCYQQTNHLPDWQTSVYYPARYPEVIAVSGTNENDLFASAPGGNTGGTDTSCTGLCEVQSGSCTNGSRYGPEVELSAPFSAPTLWRDGSYSSVQCGTSISSPMVAGVAALVWSLYPGLTNAQVRERLAQTALPRFSAIHYGAGRVDARSAAYNPPPFSVTISGPGTIMAKGTYTWSANPVPAGAYTYQWSVHYPGSGTTVLQGTQQSQSMTVYAGTGHFEMRVTVNLSSYVVQTTRSVHTCISPGSCDVL